MLVLPGAGHSTDPSTLELETTITRTISGEEVHKYRVSLDIPYVRLQLIKHGIDLELRVFNNQGRRLFRIADWRDREGWLTALLERDTASEFLLEIGAVSSTAPPGEYVIRLDHLPGSGVNAELRINAERIIMEADHARYSHYLGEGGSREHTLELFETTRNLWNQAEVPREEARALFSMAMIQQELGQMTTAHQTYEAALDLWREVGDERGIAAALTSLGLVEEKLGLSLESLDHLNEARYLREQLGDSYFLAHTINNIGMVHKKMGNSRIAMKYLVQALEAYQGDAELGVANTILLQEDYFQEQLAKLQEGGDLLAAAIALNNLGLVHSRLGEFGDALNYLENYRHISEHLGNDERAAQATLNIGQTHFEKTEHQQALDYLSQALDYFAGPDGSPYWHSLALDNLGKVHLQLGNYRRALDLFERALALRTLENNPMGRADTLQRLGEAYAAFGEPVRATGYYRQSLELRQTAIDRYREALTLDQLGVAQANLGLYDEALASHKKALEIHREAENSRGEIESLVNLGRFYASQGRVDEAVEHLQQALALTRSTGDRVQEAQGLFELAKIDMARGQTQTSIARLDEALSVIDSLRGDLISPELRASFFATQLEVHSFYIDSLMNLARSEDAFMVAERAKQRTLLDYLANTGNTATSTDIGLLKHREELRRELDANQQERMLFANKPGQTEQLAIIDKKIRDITAELERVEIMISGRRAPEQAFTEHAVPAAQVVPLLGADTLLLEYALGKDRSYAWLIGNGIFEVAALPSEKEIESRVRKLFAGLRTNNPSDTKSEQDQLKQLGKVLLGPIAAHLGEKRLAIVPDGVLHYLPFAALGDPRSNDSNGLLYDSNEIIMLPSASGLLGLRNRESSIDQQGYRVAVLADPVFTADDPRLVVNNRNAVATPGLDPLGFSRLPGTRHEAEIIQQLVEPGKALVLTGFEANLEKLSDGSLNDYNVLHFATHGIVNPAHPGLSGLVLSALDSKGREQPSFVRALDLFYMDVGAELVVLSACETALGKEIRGEGLMGMTRGFFYAGANTVVSSLWQVPDRATAELMKHFYHEMLQNNRSPAAALRVAQLKIREKRMWRDPYYWAAFTVQGDWRL